MRLAPATEVTVTSASVRLEATTHEPCHGGATQRSIDAEADLLNPVDLVELAPFAGDWCTLHLHLASSLALTGSGPDGTFDLQLDVPSIAVEGGDAPGALLLELGHPGWLHPALVVPDEPGGHTTVDLLDPRHPELASALREGSALFADSAPDGDLDDTERAAGPVAAGPEHPTERDLQTVASTRPPK